MCCTNLYLQVLKTEQNMWLFKSANYIVYFKTLILFGFGFIGKKKMNKIPRVEKR